MEEASGYSGGASPVVVLMLKAPVEGAVKTRLGREIGFRAATQTYRRLVEHQLRQIPQGWRVQVCYSPAGALDLMKGWLGPRPQYASQSEGSLGDRLTAAMHGHFCQSEAPLIFLGGDCPYLLLDCFEKVAEILGSLDVAIVPANDGGYCLIGLRRAHHSVFEAIHWSTDAVLEETRARLRDSGKTWQEFKPMEDVDDGASWQRAVQRFPYLKGDTILQVRLIDLKALNGEAT